MAVKATSENRTWDDAEYEKLARERRKILHEKINKVIAKGKCDGTNRKS